MAIMLSCPAVSCRESCSCSSTAAGARLVVGFISGAGAAGWMENAEQPDRIGSRILQAVHHSIGQVDARPGAEFARVQMPFEMQNSTALQYVDCFLVGVPLKRPFTPPPP